jgi:hypothetical protein
MKENEAREMLRRLSEYFNQPVMPIKEYCRGLETWARCIEEANETRQTDHGAAYAGMLRQVLRDIRKSDLLWRLLYDGQRLRTRKCPKHGGSWAGVSPVACPHGCGHTGWLPESSL